MPKKNALLKSYFKHEIWQYNCSCYQAVPPMELPPIFCFSSFLQPSFLQKAGISQPWGPDGLIVAVTLHFEIVVSAGKVADLQRVGILSSFGELSILLFLFLVILVFFFFFFLSLDIDFFLFLRDTDQRRGTLCPFCVPIHLSIYLGRFPQFGG